MVIISAVIFWGLFGYRYFVSSAGLELVPMVKRWLDDSYMPGDYLLNTVVSGYNHREFFITIVGVTAKVLGSVELSFLVLFVVFGISTLWAITKLVENWTDGLGSVLFCVVGVLMFWYLGIRELSPGLVTQIHGELTPNMVARAFLFWAIYFSIINKTKTALALLPLGALFQPLDVLLTFPLVVLLVVFSAGSPLRNILKKRLLFILIFGCLLAGAILIGVFEAITSVWNEELFLQFVEIRLPYHYLPSSWSVSKWIFLLAIATSGTYALLFLKKVGIAIVCIVVLALFILYVIVLEGMPVMWLYKLQGAKLLWGNYVIWSIAIFIAVSKYFSQQKKSSGLMLTSICIGGGLIFVGAVYGLSQAGHPYYGELNKKIEFNKRMLGKGNYRTARDYANASDLELAELLSYYSKPSDLILNPPERNVVRSIAERASVGLNTLAGFSPKAVAQYLERRKTLEGYCGKTLVELTEIATRYKAQYIAVQHNCNSDKELSQWQQISEYWKIMKVHY